MSAPSRPVVVVLEGISAGQYFADAALKRGLEPVVVFPKLQTTPVYQIMRQSAIEFWKNKGCRVIEPENDKEETPVLASDFGCRIFFFFFYIFWEAKKRNVLQAV